MSGAGYLRHLLDLYEGSADVTLRLDEDEPYDPAADSPYEVIRRIRLVDNDAGS